MKKLITLLAVAALLFTLAPADAALWTPTEITTTLWLDADDASTITESGGSVSQWDDKSGNNNHADQVTGSQQPQTGLNTIGGLNVIAFDGSNDYLTVQPFSSPQPHTVFFVAKTTGGPGRDYVFDGANANSDRNLVALDRSGTVQFWAGSWVNSGVATPTDPLIVAAAFNTTSSEISIDGTNTTGLNPGAFTMTNGMNLGTNYTESVDWLAGDIAEFIIVSGAPDTATRQTVEGYLAWKWGTEGNLPGGHPYEFAAPQIAGAVVPEPSTFVLTALGLLSLSMIGWRRRKQ